MDVANAPNPSLAPLFSSRRQCCLLSDIAVCLPSTRSSSSSSSSIESSRSSNTNSKSGISSSSNTNSRSSSSNTNSKSGSSSSNANSRSTSRNLFSFVLAGKKCIQNQSAYLPSPLNLPIHATTADSAKFLQSKRKGFAFAATKEKHFKFDTKSSISLVEYDVFHAWDERSVDLASGISQNHVLLLERESQEAFRCLCTETLVASCRYWPRTVRFDVESTRDRRIRKKSKNPQKKMNWRQACVYSAFALSCAAFVIHRLQSAFVNVGHSGGGGGGGRGGRGGSGRGGGGGGGEGMGESGSNVGLMAGKDEHEQRFEHSENAKGRRVSKTRALASLSSATDYRSNAEIAASGDTLTDTASTVQGSGCRSDAKAVAVNAASKREEPELSAVADHLPQTEISHKFNQKQNLVDRIARFLHSAVRKNINRQRNSHRNAQEISQHKTKPLVKEAVTSVLHQLLETSGDEAVARKSEIAALRRLQREIFSDLLRIRERLDKLEHHLGLRQIKNLGDPLGVARTRLKGVVNVGSAFAFLEDKSNRVSRFALGQAGMQTGVDVVFTFETPFRGKDMLIMECGAGQLNDATEGENSGGPVRIRKVAYSAQVTDELTVSLIPLGAEATDISDVVNSLQDRALTRFTGGGPPLFGQCKGSAIGATIGNGSALVSMSQFLSGWGSSSFDGEPLCSSTLATCIYQPSDNMIFSFSAVNNFYPSPPLPSSSKLHWSEMGPLVLSKSRTSRSNTSTHTSARTLNTGFSSEGKNFYGQYLQSLKNPSSQPNGTFGQAVSIAGEVDIGSINIGGWLQVDKEGMFQCSATKQRQWAITLANAVGSSVDWGLSLGTFKPYRWDSHSIVKRNYLDPAEDIMEISVPQTQFEAFVKFNCGKACTLQPGILYVLSEHSQTPALIFRAQCCL